MNRRQRRERLPTVTDASIEASVEARLKRTDRAVLKYLRGLARKGDGETCKASIPQIAKGSDVSPRQVQISTRRLIEVGFLENVGRDVSNPDFKERGTVFRIAPQQVGWQDALQRQRDETIKLLLDICLTFEACFEQLVMSQEQVSNQAAKMTTAMRRIKDEMAALKKKLRG